MKKTMLMFIFALFFSAVAGALFVNSVSANPGMYMYPYDPQTTAFVQSPENNTTYRVKWVNVNFTLDLTKWVVPMEGIFNPDYSFSSLAVCYLDSESIWQKTLNSAEEFSFWFTLNGLSDGLHSIMVNATAVGTYFDTEPEWSLSDAPVSNSSGTIYFTVDTTPPKVTILSLENGVYYSPDIKLDFTMNEHAQVTYSLDSKANVSLSENAVLTGLAFGRHNVTFFAEDKAGNTASQTIYFTIAEPFPTVPAATASVVTAVLVAIGLLVYLKKRKHEAELS